jgi:hypothetical protein
MQVLNLLTVHSRLQIFYEHCCVLLKTVGERCLIFIQLSSNFFGRQLYNFISINMNKFVLSILFLIFHQLLYAQGKEDYIWLIGGGYQPPIGIKIDFNTINPVISEEQTDVRMEGSNTSMCDKNGNFIFASNGCKVVNSNGDLMMNGDTINPGAIQTLYCFAGGCPHRQGVLSLPIPESDSLYVLFNLDFDNAYSYDTSFFPYAPQRLFYQIIDMSKDTGLGAIVQKNQIAILDTFSRGNIQAARQANGKDWWVIVPKSHSNCYFLVPVTSEGVQPAQLKCAGHIWSDKDSGTQAVFTPDTKKYIRFNSWNGLNIFDFDNITGDLSNPIQILFPYDTINSISGASVSPNSRYLYISARKKVYQFDLQAPDIEASKVLIAVWDGFQNPYSTLFYLSALAPDGKIYISNTSSTLNLHVINKPNCPGLSCQLVQHGIDLPTYNFATIPNIPHYRSSYEECDTTSSYKGELFNNVTMAVYPNPTKDKIWINYPNLNGNQYNISIFDVVGHCVYQKTINTALSELDISYLKNGIYFFTIENNYSKFNGKLLKID